MIKNYKKIWVVFIIGLLIFVYVPVIYKSNQTDTGLPLPFLKKTAKNKAYVLSQLSGPSLKEECGSEVEQIVVEWKSMYWFRCKLDWKGICFWPLRRRHVSYKVTIKEGIPVLDEKGRAIPVAKGKVRNWIVYDAETWNAIDSNPRLKKRYLDYEQIASNEYVVMVETRYRLFNNVESTLRICVQQP